MKLKLNFDISENELVSGLKAQVQTAVAQTFEAAVEKAKQIAGQKLGPSGFNKWEKGFRADKVTDDLYIISIEGKLASWMEDGIKVGEISQSIMAGNRAQHNKSEEKNYVDVPFMKDADQAGNIRGTNLNVKAFADADSLMKNIKLSDYKKRSIQQEKRMVSRVQDIIKSTDPKGDKGTQYMTIRRVSEGSVWPKTPFEGAKVLEELDSFIDQKFSEILDKVL